jgi:Domain of unknown function (DUF222)
MATKPLDAADALAMTQAGLSFLATCEADQLPAVTQAEVLTGLEGAEARLTAARSAVLGRFCAAHAYEADGQFGPKPWLRAFTRITPGAAGVALAWMHRLQAHPLVADALAGEVISVSWAREICAWTDRLPPELAGDADRILLAAAAAGADLRDLALLAAEMLARAAPPDGDGDGFADRSLWLDKTLAGAGRLAGDLTPACTAALAAVLDALGGKTGPEDTRSVTQRRHDALEEACQRLIGAGMVPGRDGQPLHIYAHMDLARLATATAGAAAAGSRAESRWSLARTVAGPGAWWPTGPDADAAACDATVIPVITGHVDWSLADHLISLAVLPWAVAHTPATTPPSPAPVGDPERPPGPPPGNAPAVPVPARAPAPSAPGRPAPPDPAPPGSSAAHDPPASPPSLSPGGPEHSRGPASPVTPASPAGPGHLPDPADHAGPADTADPAGLLTPEARDRLRQLVIQHATGLLSGPAGLAAQYRTRTLAHPLTGRSQPLDVGTPTPIIPPHLRRAVTLRDQHCRFPGCTQPPAVCQIHHLAPRARGGPTALANLALLCRFHHLTVIHRWAWTLTCHPDGTTTATSPDGRTLHSHSPPQRAPAA